MNGLYNDGYHFVGHIIAIAQNIMKCFHRNARQCSQPPIAKFLQRIIIYMQYNEQRIYTNKKAPFYTYLLQVSLLLLMEKNERKFVYISSSALLPGGYQRSPEGRAEWNNAP